MSITVPEETAAEQNFTRRILVVAVALAFGTGAFAQQRRPCPLRPLPRRRRTEPRRPPGPASGPTRAAVFAAHRTTAACPFTLPGTPQTSPAIPQAKPFKKIVKDAKEIPGFFTLYEKDEKLDRAEARASHTPFYLSVNRPGPWRELHLPL